MMENWSSILTSASFFSLTLSKRPNHAMWCYSANRIGAVSEREETNLLREVDVKMESFMKNGQALACPFFPRPVQNECLIYTETVAIITSGSVKRHYETKHKSRAHFSHWARESGGWDIGEKEVLKRFCCQIMWKYFIIKLVETVEMWIGVKKKGKKKERKLQIL